MPSISNCQSPNTHWCTTSQRAWRPRKIQLPLFANQHPLLYNGPYWTASFLQLATLTGIVHLNEHCGQELQVLHAARAQRHQEVKRCDHSQGRGTHGHHLLGWELALGLPALEHNFGRRENEVFHQFLKSQKTPTSETDWAHASNWMEISTLSLSTKLISHTYKSVKANEHSYTSPWGPESRDHKLSEQNVNFTQPGTHFFLMSTSLSHIMKQEILLSISEASRVPVLEVTFAVTLWNGLHTSCSQPCFCHTTKRLFTVLVMRNWLQVHNSKNISECDAL